MRKYCKAYKLRDLRQFNGWTEHARKVSQDLSDDTICYLYDDFTVVQSPFQNENALFTEVTPEWQDFCKNALRFEIPEDLHYAYEQPDA